MSHLRKRPIEERIQKAMTWAPCVGLLGMRQVGKTTLLKRFSSEYRSFDDERFIGTYEKHRTSVFENSRLPIALDEVQKFPPAFDDIKAMVDQRKKPGQFLLTGSVKFSSRKAIRESLTGRISLIEVYPFTMSECHSRPPSHFLQLLSQFDSPVFLKKLEKLKQQKNQVTHIELLHYAETGGLPGICFKRDLAIRNEMFNNHLDTLLGRDIHLIKPTTLGLRKLRDLVTQVTQLEGRPLNRAQLSRDIGCSIKTLNGVLDALEGLFLIRPHAGGYFLEDIGLSHYLLGEKATLNRMTLIALMYHELRSQLLIDFPAIGAIDHYSTRGGVDIPFVIKIKGQSPIAIMAEPDDHVSDKSMKSMTWFLKRYPKAKTIILHLGESPSILSNGALFCPITRLF